MFWYDWILFLVTASIGCFIGTMLGELTFRWYKKRKNNKENK